MKISESTKMLLLIFGIVLVAFWLMQNKPATQPTATTSSTGTELYSSPPQTTYTQNPYDGGTL